MSSNLPSSEIARIAVNLARNCGYAVYPQQENKRPFPGSHGHLDATKDPDAILDLWRRFPGPLVAIATGPISGIEVLDIDIKHDEARGWWRANEYRLPSTRTYRSRGGGLHLHLLAAGLPGRQSVLARGIDILGKGTGAIFWFAAGTECLDHNPPAPWPEWLLDELWPRPEPVLQPVRRAVRAVDLDRKIDGILRTVATAAEGTRNAILFWAACRFSELVRDGFIGTAEATGLLLDEARKNGTPAKDAKLSIRSGLRRAAA